MPDVQPALEAPDRLHSLRTGSFGGIPAAQTWADFFLWEALLNTHTDLRAIIELGTWEGGFSHYLSAQARMRGMRFKTFDVIVPEHQRPPGFQRLDIFAEPEVVIEWLELEGTPKALLCDNGNKPRELRTFPQHLPEGSIAVVHDWLDEVFPEDVPESLTMIDEEFCVGIGSMSRVFSV